MGRRKRSYLLYIVFIAIATAIAILLYLHWKQIEGFEAKQKPKGLILEMIGGLGNQIYIYSAGKVMQKALDIPIYIVLDQSSVFAHTQKDYRSILFKDFTPIDKTSEQMTDKQDARLQIKFWDPWTTETLPSTDKYVYLPQQWYQDFPSIEAVIPEVSKTLVTTFEGLYPEVKISSGSAFIHVRRGDYTNPENRVHLLDMEYYNKALNVMNSEGITKYYMFSDDIAWCKEQKWSTTIPIEYVNEHDEMKSLYMMSQCKGGAVISNSTFSTWGAILGPYEAGNKVVYPSKWLYGASTNFPEDWVRI